MSNFFAGNFSEWLSRIDFSTEIDLETEPDQDSEHGNRTKRDIFGDIFRVIGVPVLVAGTLIGGPTSTTTSTATTTIITTPATTTTLTTSTNSPISRSGMVIANEVLGPANGPHPVPPYSHRGVPPPPNRGLRVSQNLQKSAF